ncbi:MAG: metallophosphoesterase family protein [Anaerolineae bacterium]
MNRKRVFRTLVSLLVVATLAAALIVAVTRVRARLRNPPWKVTQVPEDEVICFTLYTVHDGVLKLTAQLYELPPDADHTVRLQIKKTGRWTQIAETEVNGPDWVALFRVEGWDSTRNHEYRVAHGDSAFYTGLIRRDPVDKEEMVVAAFTGNSNADRGPRPDVVENVERQDPDLLFFSGDQVYDHHDHFASWLLFGRQFGEITRNRPTVVIPDDHDVGVRNLWGDGGEPGPGGYEDPDYVRMVERAQTSHLPDPYDPTPIKRGIGVYYTSMTWGRIGFAIIEDRKFKSQIDVLDHQALEQQGVGFARPDHIEELPDPQMVDVPTATLLGERQLTFLREWTADWTGQDMKAVLSQAPFAAPAHAHGPTRQRLEADLDTNGWPQRGRERALREMRKGFALHINGDQHLATASHQGVDDWGDAAFSFSVPSVVNYYRRWWKPLESDRALPLPEGALQYAGQYKDGFGNKITMVAYANPDLSRRGYDKWHAQAAGYGVVRFNKRTREITLECWPRGCQVPGTDTVADPNCQQYPGWPITIAQEENYGRQPVAYLPTLEISGTEAPVVQVIHESSGEIVYTLRINGTSYRPKVFETGSYTVKVAEGKATQVLSGVESVAPEESATISVVLE